MHRRLESYLKEVSRYLVSDSPEDILMEIRANVLEKAGHFGELNEESIERTLAALGSPRVLAANYGEGKDIIAPDLRNYLFLYTSVLFAIHLGATIVASISGITIAMFPFVYAPAMDSLVSILTFLPFAFIFDFGLVSLVLFAASQWAPNLGLPMPEVSQQEQEAPTWWVLLIQMLGFAGFAAMWHFHSTLLGLIESTGNITVIPAQIVFLPPMVILGVAALTTAFQIFTKSKLIPVLGSVAALVSIWFIETLVENPAIFHASGEPWDIINRFGFRGLLLLMTVLTTVDLVKHVVVLMSAIQWRRELSFHPTQGRDWINTMVRLMIYISLIVLGAIFVLPVYPVLWFGCVLVGLLLLVKWHNRTFGYCCKKCGNEFEISAFLNLISPHGIGVGKEGKYGWKWLRCPKCKRFSAARVVKKDK